MAQGRTWTEGRKNPQPPIASQPPEAAAFAEAIALPWGLAAE